MSILSGTIEYDRTTALTTLRFDNGRRFDLDKSTSVQAFFNILKEALKESGFSFLAIALLARNDAEVKEGDPNQIRTTIHIDHPERFYQESFAPNVNIPQLGVGDSFWLRNNLELKTSLSRLMFLLVDFLVKMSRNTLILEMKPEDFEVHQEPNYD